MYIMLFPELPEQELRRLSPSVWYITARLGERATDDFLSPSRPMDVNRERSMAARARGGGSRIQKSQLLLSRTWIFPRNLRDRAVVAIEYSA